MKKLIKRHISKLILTLSQATLTKENRQMNRNAEILKSHLKYTFGDQKDQVNFLVNNVLNYEKNGLKRNGFFIDLACADGITINNTYFLERYLDWTGLLFEPNPNYKNSIINHRSSQLITSCVTDRAGEVVRFRIDNGMLGGIVSEEMDNSEKVRGSELTNADIIDIATTTLEFELEKVNAPHLIDFMSLDIEGGEWLALRNFPFEKYKFRCLAIERPTKDLDMLLDKHGYRQIAHLMYDVIFVHETFINDVNFSPNCRFAFTPRKNW